MLILQVVLHFKSFLHHSIYKELRILFFCIMIIHLMFIPIQLHNFNFPVISSVIVTLKKQFFKMIIIFFRVILTSVITLLY